MDAYSVQVQFWLQYHQTHGNINFSFGSCYFNVQTLQKYFQKFCLGDESFANCAGIKPISIFKKIYDEEKALFRGEVKITVEKLSGEPRISWDKKKQSRHVNRDEPIVSHVNVRPPQKNCIAMAMSIHFISQISQPQMITYFKTLNLPCIILYY